MRLVSHKNPRVGEYMSFVNHVRQQAKILNTLMRKYVIIRPADVPLKCAPPRGGYGPHLIRGSLDSLESAPKLHLLYFVCIVFHFIYTSLFTNMHSSRNKKKTAATTTEIKK